MSNKKSLKAAARRGFTLIEIMIVVLIIGILLAIAGPNFAHARDTSKAKTCIEHLHKIQYAKENWAMDNNKGVTETPVGDDLWPAGGDGYLKREPLCPSGGTYTIGDINTLPVCSEGAAKGHAH